MEMQLLVTLDTVQSYKITSDMTLIGVFCEQFLKYSVHFVSIVFLLLQISNVITSNQFVLHLRVTQKALQQPFLFQFLTTEPNWKFILTRKFNKRKCFGDEIEIYSIINFILEQITFIYIAFIAYFCLLMANQLSHSSLVQLTNILFASQI